MDVGSAQGSLNAPHGIPEGAPRTVGSTVVTEPDVEAPEILLSA